MTIDLTPEELERLKECIRSSLNINIQYKRVLMPAERRAIEEVSKEIELLRRVQRKLDAY